MKQVDFKRWALLGAQERLSQLANEATAIYKAFPELRSHAIGFGKRAAKPADAGALKRRVLSAEARTIRDGETRMIPAEELVPGDIVLLESGDKVPADLRLADAKNLSDRAAGSAP